MWQNKRSEELEILDLGPSHYTQGEYTHCLKLLDRINHWLGGFRATKNALFELKSRPKSILEVGCGGGGLCNLMSKWFPEARITGVDISQASVIIAKKANSLNKNVHIEKQHDKTLNFSSNQFDVVTAMLVCHHMNHDELVTFFKEGYRISKTSMIINDLQRHILAFASFYVISPIFFPNRLIWNDGCLSIRRGFHKNELIDALRDAGFRASQYKIKWNFAFRWTVQINKI